MHAQKQINLLLIALTAATIPVFADSIEVTASSGTGEPKFAQRIKDLGEQIQLVQSKHLISEADATKFNARISELKTIEEQTRKNGFPKAESDKLEKDITGLNGELFAASHKSNPVKPGQAEKEVNDPNLIPAYPDKNLQPGSGEVSK